MIIFELPPIKNRYHFNILALLIGAVLPDIVDKSLMLFNLSSGRGIAHSLIFTAICFSVLLLSTKINLAISLPFLAGMMLHLILDIPEVPWFYPFVSYDFSYPDDPLGSWLVTLFTDPVVLTTEIVGIAILVYIFYKNRLFNLNRIKSYLISNQLEKKITKEVP